MAFATVNWVCILPMHRCPCTASCQTKCSTVAGLSSWLGERETRRRAGLWQEAVPRSLGFGVEAASIPEPSVCVCVFLTARGKCVAGGSECIPQLLDGAEQAQTLVPGPKTVARRAQGRVSSPQARALPCAPPEAQGLCTHLLLLTSYPTNGPQRAS